MEAQAVIHVCGWCGRYMGASERKPLLTVSHGMCPHCEAEQHAEMRGTEVHDIEFKRWIEDLAIFVIGVLLGAIGMGVWLT